MAQLVKHLKRRGGVYQYERRVPRDIINDAVAHQTHFNGKPSVRRSLMTSDVTEALRAWDRAHADFEWRVGLARGKALAIVARQTRPVTPDLLYKIREEQRVSTFEPYSAQSLWLEADPTRYEDELDRMREHFEQDAERIDAVLRLRAPTNDGRLDVAGIASDYIDRENLEAPAGSIAKGSIQTAVREGLRQGYREVGELLSGTRSAIPTPADRRSPKAPLISEVVSSYVGGLDKRRTIAEVDAALRDFIVLIGDLPLDELKGSHFRRFCDAEGRREIGGKTRNSVTRSISPDTVRKKIRLLRAAIQKAIGRGIFEGANPAAGIDIEAFTKRTSARVMPDKRPFATDELNRIFAYPWFSGCKSERQIHTSGDHLLTGMHFWAPVLALMTGCRAGEIGGLMVNEVRIDHQYPHIVIQDNAYRTTKGSYSRLIPMLDQLMELGFGDMIATARSDGRMRLFDDWKAPSGRADTDDPAWSNGSVIRSFNQTLIPAALETTTGIRREVTFHSFRGAFKTLLGLAKFNLPPNYIHEVVGHAKIGLDQRYIRKIPIDETYPAIRACKFEGLAIGRTP